MSAFFDYYIQLVGTEEWDLDKNDLEEAVNDLQNFCSFNDFWDDYSEYDDELVQIRTSWNGSIKNYLSKEELNNICKKHCVDVYWKEYCSEYRSIAHYVSRAEGLKESFYMDLPFKDCFYDSDGKFIYDSERLNKFQSLVCSAIENSNCESIKYDYDEYFDLEEFEEMLEEDVDEEQFYNTFDEFMNNSACWLANFTI